MFIWYHIRKEFPNFSLETFLEIKIYFKKLSGDYMQKKEIFTSRLSQLTNGMLKKDIAAIMGCTPETLSKYRNPEMKNFPNVEELYLLCEHFHVSIDWILGREEKKQIIQKLSAREICEFIKSMCENDQCNLTDISVSEDCYSEDIDYNGCVYVNHKRRENNYKTLYFSEWNQDIVQNPCYDAESNGGNYVRRAININYFIERYLKIKELYDDGSINSELYETIISSMLESVPDSHS